MQSFDEWMDEVDSVLSDIIGMVSSDIPDYAYRDDCDDDISPTEAALSAIENMD